MALAIAGSAVVALLAIFIVGVFTLDTSPGHRLLTFLVSRLSPANGLKVSIGEIDGSIYRRATLKNVTLSDPDGPFFVIPKVTLDWRAAALLNKRLEITTLQAPTASFLRKPHFRPTPPKPFTLPDLRIDLGRLQIGRLVLAPALTGDQRQLTVDAGALIADGRVRLKAKIVTVARNGGDKLLVDVDASPAANRLFLAADLKAPAGGVIDHLANLGGALDAHVGGAGDWRNWRGRANATLAGRPLLSADLIAHSGAFGLTGRAEPDLLIHGTAPTRLFDPALQFTVYGKMANRVASGAINLSSPSLTLAAAGKLDLAKGAFDGVHVRAAVQPDAVNSQLSGARVTLDLLLDGGFTTPSATYDLQAASLGYGRYGANGLKAKGRIRSRKAGEFQIPLHVTMASLTGLPPSFAGLGSNVRVDGDVRIFDGRFAADNLRLRSDHAEASMTLRPTPDAGSYRGAFSARINHFHAQGLGVLDLVADAKLEPAPRGCFSISGQVRAKATKVENKGLADLLGGTAVLTGNFGRTPEGVATVGQAQLTSPRFKVLDARGTYGADGALSFSARAVSKPYGSAALTLTGTAKAPTATLRSARLDLGVPLTAVDVKLAPAQGGFSLGASAQSPYGPLHVDAGLLTAKPPLVIDIRRLSLDDLTAHGRLTQTSSGPFAGQLQLSGGGLSGPLTLSAQGKAQRIDAMLQAHNARLPLKPQVTVANGRVEAEAVIGAGAPVLTADVTASGVRQSDLVVDTARVKLDYRGGSGTATVTASGQRGAPFSLALSAGFQPDAIRIEGKGSVRNVSMRLAQPAILRKTQDGYSLAATQLILPHGSVEASGTIGRSTALDLRLTNVDLGLANAFDPNLLIGGRVNGVINLSLPAHSAAGPQGHARLQIDRFTRSSLNTVSEPIDIDLAATLAGADGSLSTVFRRRGAVIGRSQLQLKADAGGTQDWLQRFKTAQVSGGLRYNGPVEALWALSGISGQQLTGPIAIGADVSGRLNAPQLRGMVSSKALHYQNAKFGTSITDLAIDGTFIDTRFSLKSVSGKTPGGGSVTGSGAVDLSAAKGFPVDLKLDLRNAVLARSEGLDATVSGSLALTNSQQSGALISGDLTVDQARYAIAKTGAADVPVLTGVRRRGAPLKTSSAAPADTGPPSQWKLDIHVRAANQVFVSGLGLDAEWRSDLRIQGDANHPVIVGDVRLIRGTYAFAGRRLSLSRGIIHLEGSNPPDPSLDLEATSVVDGVTATIDIQGTANHPRISFTSSPALPQDEVLSRLLFGSSVAQISPLQAVQLAASLNALRGGGGGLNALGKLRQASGLDELKFSGGDQASGRGPAIGAGRYIGKNVYVEVTTDARGFTATQIEIALSKTLRLLSQVSSFGASNVSLKYSKDY